MKASKNKSVTLSLKLSEEEAALIERLRLTVYVGATKSEAVRRAIIQVATGTVPLVTVSPASMQNLANELSKTEQFIAEIERARQAVWQHGATANEKAERLHAADQKLNRMIEEFESLSDRVRTLIRSNNAISEVDITGLKKAAQSLREWKTRLSIGLTEKSTKPELSAQIKERVEHVDLLLSFLAKSGLGSYTEDQASTISTKTKISSKPGPTGHLK